jgi:hypothetical protein
MATVMVPMLLVPILGLLVVRRVLPESSAPAGPRSTSSAPLAASPSPSKPDLDTSADVAGRVFDADGNPVRGATVRVVLPRQANRVLGDTTTDGAGRFSFAHVEAWPARVVADHDPEGFASSRDIAGGDGLGKDVTLVLSPAGAVRGTVVDDQGHPISGATLSVEWPSWPVPTSLSDEAGNFHLAIVPDEATALVASAHGYETTAASLGPREDRANVVLHVVMGTGGPVDGDVRGTDDEPVSARIVACAGQPTELRTTSKDDGTFQLPSSAIGCPAVADLEGFASSDAVVVAEGRRTRLQLKAGGAIEGMVVDERGSGVTSFTLGIESYTSARGRLLKGGGARKIEDPRGSFLWDKLSPGNYVLSATTQGKPVTRSESIAVRAGAPTRGVRIVLREGGRVVGRVFDESKNPLADAFVRFDALSSVVENGGGVRTDELGRYALDAAPAGPFTVYVHKDTYRDRNVSGIRVASGATVTVDITLAGFDGSTYFDLVGIGVGLQQTDNGLEVGQVGKWDPAWTAGIKDGDLIRSIDGETTEGMSTADATQRLRGEAHTVVGVSVLRPSTGQTIDLTIPRAQIVR